MEAPESPQVNDRNEKARRRRKKRPERRLNSECGEPEVISRVTSVTEHAEAVEATTVKSTNDTLVKQVTRRSKRNLAKHQTEKNDTDLGLHLGIANKSFENDEASNVAIHQTVTVSVERPRRKKSNVNRSNSPHSETVTLKGQDNPEDSKLEMHTCGDSFAGENVAQTLGNLRKKRRSKRLQQPMMSGENEIAVENTGQVIVLEDQENITSVSKPQRTRRQRRHKTDALGSERHHSFSGILNDPESDQPPSLTRRHSKTNHQFEHSNKAEVNLPQNSNRSLSKKQKGSVDNQKLDMYGDSKPNLRRTKHIERGADPLEMDIEGLSEEESETPFSIEKSQDSSKIPNGNKIVNLKRAAEKKFSQILQNGSYVHMDEFDSDVHTPESVSHVSQKEKPNRRSRNIPSRSRTESEDLQDMIDEIMEEPQFVPQQRVKKNPGKSTVGKSLDSALLMDAVKPNLKDDVIQVFTDVESDSDNDKYDRSSVRLLQDDQSRSSVKGHPGRISVDIEQRDENGLKASTVESYGHTSTDLNGTEATGASQKPPVGRSRRKARKEQSRQDSAADRNMLPENLQKSLRYRRHSWQEEPEDCDVTEESHPKMVEKNLAGSSDRVRGENCVPDWPGDMTAIFDIGTSGYDVTMTRDGIAWESVKGTLKGKEVASVHNENRKWCV